MPLPRPLPLPAPLHLGEALRVVADLAGWYSTENLKGMHVAFEEGFLSSGCRRPMNSLARVRHSQREQVAGDELAAQLHCWYRDGYLEVG